MDRAISIYLKYSENDKGDENANFTVIVPAEKADEAKRVIEDSISRIYPYAHLPEIGLKSSLTQKLTEAGIMNRVLPQRIIANDDTIWTLSLVTNNFYFYMDQEQMDDVSGIIMFRTQVSEELVSDNYFACVGFREEIIDIAAEKAAVAYINAYTSDVLGSFKEEFADEIETARNSQDMDGDSEEFEH
ncbi:MAG: hypothetical protein ACRDBO_17575 [Lachnospiraceae bacterium]